MLMTCWETSYRFVISIDFKYMLFTSKKSPADLAKSTGLLSFQACWESWVKILSDPQYDSTSFEALPQLSCLVLRTSYPKNATHPSISHC